MMPRVALTTLTGHVDLPALASVAAALQTQVIRDFTPAWGFPAVITAAPIEAIPYGYVPVIVQEGLVAETAVGIHCSRHDESPYIIIPAGPSWSLSASHEVLRMLADPTGSARAHLGSPLPGQGTVEYIVDVCAPCRDIACAYVIDGIIVSDFALPAFYHPNGIGPRYSFTGALRQPFQAAPGGTMTWFADDRLIYQAYTGRSGRLSLRGGFSPATRGRLSLREFLDALLPDRLLTLSQATPPASIADAIQDASRARLSNMLRYQDEVAWRYGPAVAMPSLQRTRNPRTETPAGPRYARSGHQRASSVEATTERTAS